RGPRTAKAEPPSLRAGAFLAEPVARLQLVFRPKAGNDGVRRILARRSWRSSSKLSCEDTGCPNCIRSASERMPARSLAFGLLQELATTRRRPTRSAFEEFPNLAQSLHEYSLALQSASLNGNGPVLDSGSEIEGLAAKTKLCPRKRPLNGLVDLMKQRVVVGGT